MLVRLDTAAKLASCSEKGTFRHGMADQLHVEEVDMAFSGGKGQQVQDILQSLGVVIGPGFCPIRHQRGFFFLARSLWRLGMDG